MNRVKIPIFGNEFLKDVNGRTVCLGDKLSFGGIIAEVIWWEEQGRFYLDFGNNNLSEAIFYTWLHRNFEIVTEV